MSFLFFSHGFIEIRFALFVFVLSNKYYLSKLLMLLDFRCQKISFPCKHNFCIDEKHTQYDIETLKQKYFMKVLHGSWNTTETVFHEMLWKKRFTVYPSLNKISGPLHIRINGCILYQFNIDNNSFGLFPFKIVYVLHNCDQLN